MGTLFGLRATTTSADSKRDARATPNQRGAGLRLVPCLTRRTERDARAALDEGSSEWPDDRASTCDRRDRLAPDTRRLRRNGTAVGSYAACRAHRPPNPIGVPDATPRSPQALLTSSRGPTHLACFPRPESRSVGTGTPAAGSAGHDGHSTGEWALQHPAGQRRTPRGVSTRSFWPGKELDHDRQGLEQICARHIGGSTQSRTVPVDGSLFLSQNGRTRCRAAASPRRR